MTSIDLSRAFSFARCLSVSRASRSEASSLSLIWRAVRNDRGARVGLIIVVVMVAGAVLAPHVAPFDPNLDADPTARLVPAGSWPHLLGTDGQGRDVLSRLLWGSRLSILVGLLPVLLATCAGLVLGLLAGYYGRWFGTVVMRLTDIFFAFPMVLLGVALGAVLGAGTINLIITLTVVFLPFITRVVFRATEQVKGEEYVLAARVCGARDFDLIVGQIMPNVMSSVVVYATTNIGLMIVFGSGLSFLGVGVQPPVPEWGTMVSSGMRYLSIAPHVSTIPGIAILLTALGFNLIGDGLRDALDPRQRRTIEQS